MIDARIGRLQLRHSWTIARGTSAVKENVFVRLERDGITGYGEAAPNQRYGETAVDTLHALEVEAAFLEACDWSRYEWIGRELRRRLAAQRSACSALDSALLDWCGKAMGQPLYKIWGLDAQGAPPTSYSIGIDQPEAMQEKARAAERFAILKVKLGTPHDRTIIEAVRAVSDKPLRVDANEGWSCREEALEKIRWLEAMNVELVEQPLPDAQVESVEWLRARVSVPIVADESALDSKDLVRLREAYDGINIKLAKTGGIQEALRMIHSARALGLKIMLGCMIESSNGIAAAAQLSSLVDWVDLDGHLLLAEDPFSGLELVEGKVLVSNRPGLGVAPAES